MIHKVVADLELADGGNFFVMASGREETTTGSN